MKISELISALAGQLVSRGDLYVETYIPNCCYGDYQQDPELCLSPDGRTLYL